MRINDHRLELKCDGICEANTNRWTMFRGESIEDCMTQARLKGWQLGRKYDHCPLCPKKAFSEEKLHEKT